MSDDESKRFASIFYSPWDVEISFTMGFNPCPGMPDPLIRFIKRKCL